MKSLPLNNNENQQALVPTYELRNSSLAPNTLIFRTIAMKMGEKEKKKNKDKMRNRWLVCILNSQLAFSLTSLSVSSSQNAVVVMGCCDSPLEMMLLAPAVNWLHRCGFEGSKLSSRCQCRERCLGQAWRHRRVGHPQPSRVSERISWRCAEAGDAELPHVLLLLSHGESWSSLC